jgi:hypothetical protein
MNITEMHLAVQQGVDKINSFQADTLLSQEIDLELNKAIDKFVNLKYGKNNQYGKGFEESQKRIDDLRNIVVDEELEVLYIEEIVNDVFVYRTATIVGDDMILYHNLPKDYRYLINATAVIEHNKSCTALTPEQQQLLTEVQGVTERVSVKFVQQDDIFSILADPFNTTKKTKPLITFGNKVIDIYTNDIFIIKTLKLTYIKNPAKVSLSLDVDEDDVNCDLAEHTHQEIVDMTISSILEGISDPRYKTHQNELSKNE